jgi:hypothetical protein
VLWPADEIHGAWTDYSHMRAFVVEFAGPDDGFVRGILPGQARELLPGEAEVAKADGQLAERPGSASGDRAEGEPL